MPFLIEWIKSMLDWLQYFVFFCLNVSKLWNIRYYLRSFIYVTLICMSCFLGPRTQSRCALTCRLRFWPATKTIRERPWGVQTWPKNTCAASTKRKRWEFILPVWESFKISGWLPDQKATVALFNYNVLDPSGLFRWVNSFSDVLF